jgi:HEAT repeat protein
VRLLTDPAAFLDASDPAIRRLAVSGCVAAGIDERVARDICRIAASDPDGSVRAMAIEALGGYGSPCSGVLEAARDEDDPRVVEALATAYGELGDRDTVPWLIDLATSEGDRASREAAVAALGAIGDPAALPVLLRLVEAAPAQVRRRAVVALTVFDDPAVEPAIRRAAADRNPSVREAAEMVVGRTPS